MSAPLPKRAFVCRAEIAPFRPHNRGPNARKQTGLALPAVMDLHAALFGASAPGGAPSREDSSVVVRRDAVGASSSGRKQAKADRKKARKAAGERRLEGETAPEGRRSKKRSRSASAAAGAKRGRAAASADADAPRGELGQLALASLRAGAPSLRAQREALPVLQHAEAIASALATSPSGAIVVVGETGSGKTTREPRRVPQLLLMAGAAGPPSLPRGATVRRGQTIGVSQPRRVAATTISSRVAQEMGTSVGGADGLVGYSVRFDTRAGPRTRVRFATDGMLLREAQTDHLLGRYGVMIVDEAHERSVSTDVLLGVVRRAMALRARPDSPLPPLRVVVMSATLDAQKFSRFFAAPAGEDGMGAVPDEVAEPSSGSADAAAACPVVTVPGRQHPVTVAYLSSPSDNVVDDAVAAAMQTHLADVGWPAAAGDEEAAIAQGFDPAAASLTDASLSRNGYLVFLPGAEEIDDAVSGLRARSEALPPSLPRLHVCPLYAALPPEVQMRAFDQPPLGARKVVVSTNIAETSVTVSGVSTVIDSGIVKVRGFASLTGIQTLRPAPVAQAQARQRAGRAGREGPGRCLRLFAEADWAMLRPQPEAEIHRASLDSVVLRLVSMGVHPGRVQAFPLIEAPPPESLRGSLTRLLQLRAVDASSGQLTARGHAMAALPVEPAAASLLLAAREAGCLEDMCAVVALSDAEGLLQTPRDKEAAAMRARRGFSAWEGDHVMMVRL
ncbi:DHX8, partial [Symbiodinium sp. KB8]